MARSHSPIKRTLIKKGKRTYGAIYELPSGNQCYLAWRRVHDIFRAGEKTISDALRKGTAAWAIDEETLLGLRAKGVRFVGVIIKSSEDIYLTTIDVWFDKTKAKMLDYSGRNGSLQRYLPIVGNFRVKQGRRVSI